MNTEQNLDSDLDDLQTIMGSLDNLLTFRDTNSFIWNKQVIQRMNDLQKWINTKWETSLLSNNDM